MKVRGCHVFLREVFEEWQKFHSHGMPLTHRKTLQIFSAAMQHFVDMEEDARNAYRAEAREEGLRKSAEAYDEIRAKRIELIRAA